MAKLVDGRSYKKSQRYAKDNGTACLIARSDKSVAYVTNNRRLYSAFCTIEANYWQTRSIARPLCDSRASCLWLLAPWTSVVTYSDLLTYLLTYLLTSIYDNTAHILHKENDALPRKFTYSPWMSRLVKVNDATRRKITSARQRAYLANIWSICARSIAQFVCDRWASCIMLQTVVNTFMYLRTKLTLCVAFSRRPVTRCWYKMCDNFRAILLTHAQ